MDIKKLITGKKKPVTVNGSRYPNGTQSLVPVADIRQGAVSYTHLATATALW